MQFNLDLLGAHFFLSNLDPRHRPAARAVLGPSSPLFSEWGALHEADSLALSGGISVPESRYLLTTLAQLDVLVPSVEDGVTYYRFSGTALRKSRVLASALA